MKVDIDHNSSIPLHIQIESILRKLIESGDYNDEKLFPTEDYLSKQFGVARNTVRQSIQKLVSEGLLIRKKAIGTFVSKPKIITKLNQWHSFTREMKQRNIDVVNYEISTSFEDLNEEIANILGLPLNTSVLKLVRLRGDAECPYVYFVSYLHPGIGLSGNEDYTRPLYDILDEKKIVTYLSSEEISATIADRFLVLKLKMKKGEPILMRKRKVYDKGNNIVEYNICYYRADKFKYSIDVER